MSIRPSPLFITRCIRCHHAVRSASSSAAFPEPSMVAKLRSDLKLAMREKDTNRLDVIRGILADITNASKVERLVPTDGQVFASLTKRIKSSTQAASAFEAAKRDELREKEVAQIKILEEYLSSVVTPTDDNIKSVVAETVAKLKEEGAQIHMSTVIKRLLRNEGPYHGKPLSMPKVTEIVRDAIAAIKISQYPK